MMKKNPSKSSSNGLHKIVSPESVIVGNNYTFNLNPNTAPTDIKRNGELSLQVPPWFNHIVKGLNKLRYCKYTLYHELSPGAKWHYHGVITITEVINFFIFDVFELKKLGAFEIDTIKDLDIWMTYCTKQRAILEPFMKSLRVPYIITEKTKDIAIDALCAFTPRKDAKTLTTGILNDEDSDDFFNSIDDYNDRRDKEQYVEAWKGPPDSSITC